MPVIKRVYLTFPKGIVTEPVICDMYDKLHVKFSIRTASVNDHIGIIALELSAENPAQINRALDYFRSRGVTAEPIEMDVITG